MKTKPSVDNELPNYIFGYGSLMALKTRLSIASKATEVMPAIVKGYARGWFVRQDTKQLSCTYLGTVPAKKIQAFIESDSVNGILYAVSEQELVATDVFESAGYKRVLIPAAQLTLLEDSASPPVGNIWMYEANFNSGDTLNASAPSKKYPIIQSYLDTCIEGCLETEAAFPHIHGFLDAFINTTLFWNEHIFDDRCLVEKTFNSAFEV